MSTATTATGAPPAGAGAAGGASPADPYVVLVNHSLILLLALVALVITLRIPRAFARLWRLSEWTRGHFLGYDRSTVTGLPEFPYAGTVAPTTIDLSKGAGSSQDSHTYESKFAVPIACETPGSYPPHVQSTPSFFRPMVALMRSRAAPGVSATQMLVCAGWLGVMLYPAIYGSKGPFTDINRYGVIAISQVPFIFAFLASKNNVLGMFWGMGYEKLNFLHRFVARLAIASAHLHGLGYIYKWCLANSFMQEISQPKNYFGLCMLLSFDCILLSSLAFVRKNAYNVFLYSHIAFFTTLVSCAFYHYPQVLPYLYATCVIFGFDKLMRIAKTRVEMATIRALPQLGMTRIEIPNLNKGWRAGQHVRVQVLSFAMGTMGWAQVHPFTIASESDSKEGLVLMCKETGTWTTKLFAVASRNQAEWDVGRNIRVIIEGPYGGPGFTMFNSFSGAMFVVGGSGITFALSAIQELIQHGLRGESRVRVIELIWIIQDAGALMPLVPQFIAMIQQSASAGARLTISVHYTKAIVGEIRFGGVPPGITLSPGRPRLIGAIEGTIAHTVSTGAGGTNVHSGMIVAVCGPVSLADDVSKAASLVDPVKQYEIGGIEVHEESVFFTC
ncbi:Ferric reductase transmembrane component 5 [Mycena sanguinolenta]|uniref:ferric-chelate reductase (NADPH) n=1 Tax=Mycena sanguinolenta TaxID=230812 RepID=A0A8H7DNH5_9AGAR|nr:Ferric reductase transmembrane component 5 [Mycena sanguinolenta]